VPTETKGGPAPNVYQVVNNRSSIRSESFNYDALNRIANAQETTGTQWGESYTIDAWGNMTQIGSYNGKPHESLSTSAATNNQLIGFGYDAAGNMTSNGTASYTYDAENRLIATAGSSYIYDGNGERVEKCTEGTTPGTCASGATGTLYWRFLGSDPLSETNLAGTVQNTYVFFGGQRVARVDSAGAVHYYFSDQVGSHGVVDTVSTSGAVSCDQDIDYFPYGGVQYDYCGGSGVTQNYKFTGKERDVESGLDNFGARFDASSLGRFMTPDWAAKPVTVPYAKFGDPQSLNLYSYVENGPVNRIDPDGHNLIALSALFAAEQAQRCQDTGGAACNFISNVANAAGQAAEQGSTDSQQNHANQPDAQSNTQNSNDGLNYKKDIAGNNIPNPATGELKTVLACTQSCVGKEFTVTSTSEPVKGHPDLHGPGTPHGEGEAADIRLSGGKADVGKAVQCAANCGAKAAFDEYNHPSAHATGPHLHIQTVPTKSGGRGDLPEPED
jgi:RHS repeat-associated protein